MNSLLFLIDLQAWRPENLFGGQVLERTPAGLSSSTSSLLEF
jgi:hypothetical protein